MSYYFSNDLFDLLQLENRHKSPLTRKPTQTTQPTFPSKGKNQKEEGIHPKAWEKETSSRVRKKIEKTEIQHKWKNKGEVHKQNKQKGNKQSTWKIIQNNDSQDTPKTWIWIFTPRPSIHVDTQGVFPTRSKNVPDRPRLTSFLLQRKRDGTDIWSLLWHSLGVWKPSLGAGTQGPLPLENDLQASTFQPCVTLSMQKADKAIFLGRRKGIHRDFVFRPLFAASVSLLRCQTSRPRLRFSIPESGPYVSLHFLRLANIFLGQSSIAQEESGCESVFEDTGCHTGVNLVKGTLQLWWARAEELWASPLFQKSQSREPG